jgi:transposase-like protein
MAQQLSAQMKRSFLLAKAQGASVALLASQSGVSRTTIYHWLKKAEAKPSREQHWKSLTQRKANKVIRIATTYPHYSITQISKRAGVSRTYVWSTLQKAEIRLQPKVASNKSTMRKYQILSSEKKREIILQSFSQVQVTILCENYGISRTTFYNLIKRMPANGSYTTDIYTDRRGKGAEHYRYKGFEDRVVRYSLKHPDLSIREIATALSKRKKVSSSYVYTVLKENNLSTQAKRIAAATQKSSNVFIEMPALPSLVFDPISAMQHFMQGILVPVGVGGLALYIIATRPMIIDNNLQTLPKPVIQFNTLHGEERLWLQSKEIYGRSGALAVNPNKSIYTEKDIVRIGISSLDQKGMADCYARLVVTVLDPAGTEETYSSAEHSIIRSTSCGPRSITNDSDYTILPHVQKEGLYEIAVKNIDSGQVARSQFVFSKQTPFEIARTAPIRIWPVVPYQSTITVKANQDFVGEIHESIPSDFAINEGIFTVEINKNHKNLAWKVAMKKGEERSFTYTFDSPDVSPYAYHIEPVTLTDTKGNVVMREQAPWQIAIDGLE